MNPKCTASWGLTARWPVAVAPVGKDVAVSQTLPFDAPITRQVSLTRLVGELARAIAEVGKISVEGEVHRPTTSGANRTYFVLRDRGAQLSVAVPASRQRYCRVKEGERVAVTGTIEMIVDRGALQLTAQEVVPVGSGAIAAMIAETRERLRRDGLLDRARRPIPMLPRCIGVLCGTEAAVRKDIESVVAARFPGYPVRFLEVTVSGPGAVESLITGIDLLQRDRSIDVVDVIVLARGGGDPTQLLPFSDEQLCRIIAASQVPIVSAIGHDGDRPLSDDVADARAGTPSIAAAMVVPDRAVLCARIDAAFDHSGNVLTQVMERGSRRLVGVAWQTALDRRLERSADRLARIDWSNAVLRLSARSEARLTAIDWSNAMLRHSARARVRLAAIDWSRGVDERVRRASLQLDGLGQRVEALSPVRVLERGYAVVRTADGAVVRAGDQVQAGDVIGVQVASGRFSAVVDGPSPSAEPPPSSTQQLSFPQQLSSTQQREVTHVATPAVGQEQ